MLYSLILQTFIATTVLGYFPFKQLVKQGYSLNLPIGADSALFESEGPVNDNYSPFETACPRFPLLRIADGLSFEEQHYIQNRNIKTSEAVAKLIKRLSIPGFNSSSYTFDKSPVIALAISGGGYRSMLTAGGVIAAFDDRTTNSTDKGHIGGILQGSSYIAGVSGGSWLVSSLSLHEYLPVTSVMKYWNINEPLLEGVPNFDLPRQDSESQKSTDEKQQLRNVIKREFKDKSLTSLIKQVLSNEEEVSPGTLQTKDILRYYRDLHLDVRPKKQMGFSLSFTDYWGRAIAKRIFPEFEKSPGITLSDLTKLDSFKKFQQPFPILVANAQDPGREFDHLNSQIFEFNPFEFGCWDNSLNHFMKTRYLGTEMVNGTVKGEKQTCVKGFDNLGFITGTSSSLFNNVIIYIWQVAVSSKKEAYEAIKSILAAFGLNLDKLDNTKKSAHSDYALYSPNPFYGLQLYKGLLGNLVNSSSLFLADGGEDGENIPFQPLIQKYRKVDIIFAVDSTSDYNNWPNGTTINLTLERYHSDNSSYCYKSYVGNGDFRYSFPHVPKPSETIEQKLNAKPLWLGCDISNYPELLSRYVDRTATYVPPLIVYLPNSQQSYLSNTSTFKLTYNDNEVQKMIQNGYNIATYQNSTVDEYYSQCIGCAILKRDFDRKNLKDKMFKIPRFCEKCYKRYCWSYN